MPAKSKIVPPNRMTHIPPERAERFLAKQAFLAEVNHPDRPIERFSRVDQIDAFVGQGKFEEWQEGQLEETGRKPSAADFVKAMGPFVREAGPSVVIGAMSNVANMNRDMFVKGADYLQTMVMTFGGGNHFVTNPHLVQAMASPGHDLNSVKHWQDCMQEDLTNWAHFKNAVLLPPSPNMHTGEAILPLNSSHGTYLETLLLRTKGGTFSQMRFTLSGNLETEPVSGAEIDRMLSASPLIKKWEEGEILRTDKEGSRPLLYKETDPSPGVYVYGVDKDGSLFDRDRQSEVEAAAMAYYQAQGKSPELINSISWARICERRETINADLVYERPEGLRLPTDEIREENLDEDQKRISHLMTSNVIVLTPGWEKSKWGAFVAGAGEQVAGARMMEAVPSSDGGWTIRDIDLPSMRKSIARAIHRQAELSSAELPSAPSPVARVFPKEAVRPATGRNPVPENQVRTR